MYKTVFDWSDSNSLECALGEGVLTVVKEFGDGDNSSCLWQLSESAGEGYIELLTLNSELSISIFNCIWRSPIEVLVNDDNRIRLNFSLELDIIMEFLDCEDVGVNQPSWRLINNARNQPNREIYSEEVRTAWVTLAFSPAYIGHILGEEFLGSDDHLAKLFTKAEGHSEYQEYPLDHRLNHIVSNMISSHLDERLHMRYMASKADELICIAADHILEARSEPNSQLTLREQDKKAIYLAREILLSNLGSAPSIKELCLIIGMNRNKLHYGFKQLCGNSISRFLQEARLAEAYRQLELTDHNLLQIALNVGFGHQSSFSTAFRKQYGFSPKDIRKNCSPSDH